VKIVDVSVTVVEHGRSGRVPRVVPAGTPRRLRYTHEWVEGGKVGFDGYEAYLRVRTDDDVEGVCTCSSPEMTPRMIEILRATVIGMDPLYREEIYQRLHLGTRWTYQPPGWFGNFDNCLWDIAGKVAGMPVCQLIGQVRDRVPAYHTGDDGDGTAEHYLRMLAEVRERWGITAYKFHNYQGPRQNIPLFRRLRRELGDDFTLINDPVCSYSLREAIEVGHVMEELGFLWLEEPFREQELRQYQELCRELTIPVMATEMLMHDVNICAQWLIAGATDLVRANARGGTTALLKMAHFAELYGANVELNAGGGLGGHVHANLECAIANTELFEHFARFPALARDSGIANPPEVVDGHLAPSMLPGWGAEIDWDYVAKRTVQTY
jgi:L-alanine-DL-glutamate epimerase-like enolase superfamily enzyme